MWKLILILLGVSACKQEGSKISSENLSVLGFRSSRITVEGSAIKGLVKNAVVNITPLNTDGTCSTGTVLAAGTTDSLGDYSLTYTKTGSNVCLIVKKNSNGKSAVYDEKTGQDILIGSDSKFEMQTIIQESKVKSNRKNALVSPFSRMLFSRLKVLAKQAGSSADMSKLIPQASKEIVIRFGLNKGFSSTKSAAEKAASSVSDKDYPELDDVIVELQNPTSPVTMKFLSILMGFSYLASKHKKGTALSIEDIDAIIEALAEDFSDGIFDGVNSSGTAVTVGPSKTPLGNNSLTGVFFPAVQSYFNEGGTLYFGQNGSTPNISVVSYLSQIVFADTVGIVSEYSSASAAVAPSISFAASVYAPTENTAMTAITPTVSGTITSCTSSPSLPTGMSINSTTCAITGTPTARKTSALYTITAAGSAGSASASITIAVIPSTFLKIFYTAGSLGPNLVGPNGDSTCMADGNKPGGGSTYKAMAALTIRRACTTANCSGGASENLNWVLYPNTQYRRGDGTTVIGTTTSSAIFTFNLTNSIAGTAVFPSTFFNIDWTQSATENCSDGTSTVGNLRYGAGNSNTNTSINNASTGCNAGARELYCVEQ